MNLSEGQRVRVFSNNARGNRWSLEHGGVGGTVIRVGRTLVDLHVEGVINSYRLDTGRINDEYGDRYFLTEEAFEDRIGSRIAMDRIQAHGFETRVGRYEPLSADQLRRLADLLDRFAEENS